MRGTIPSPSTKLTQQSASEWIKEAELSVANSLRQNYWRVAASSPDEYVNRRTFSLIEEYAKDVGTFLRFLGPKGEETRYRAGDPKRLARDYYALLFPRALRMVIVQLDLYQRLQQIGEGGMRFLPIDAEVWRWARESYDNALYALRQDIVPLDRELRADLVKGTTWLKQAFSKKKKLDRTYITVELEPNT
jgi:hypothetical protein